MSRYCKRGVMEVPFCVKSLAIGLHNKRAFLGLWTNKRSIAYSQRIHQPVRGIQRYSLIVWEDLLLQGKTNCSRMLVRHVTVRRVP